eukprot:scaffold213622_cov43-Prasinocladus_malaysianus.AAC.1
MGSQLSFPSELTASRLLLRISSTSGGGPSIVAGMCHGLRVGLEERSNHGGACPCGRGAVQGQGPVRGSF